MLNIKSNLYYGTGKIKLSCYMLLSFMRQQSPGIDHVYFTLSQWLNIACSIQQYASSIW